MDCERFPLHFIVFKQTVCHLPLEANVEQVFSRAGNLSDPNMDPEYLAHLVMVGIKKKSYKPVTKPSSVNVKDKYYELFRGQGGNGLERNEGMEEGKVSSSVCRRSWGELRHEHTRHGLLVISGLERGMVLLFILGSNLGGVGPDRGLRGGGRGGWCEEWARSG